MIQIGEMNELTIARTVDFGVYLSDGERDILLPRRQVPERARIGDRISVFVYTDSEDRPVATRKTPAAVAGKFAYMRCIGASRVGAFMDWGLEKDLLVPFAEQRIPIQEGQSHVVRVYRDEASMRVVGSTKVTRFLDEGAGPLKPGDSVEILAYGRLDHGTMVIVNDQFSALVFDEEQMQPLRVGDRRKAYLKKIREDGKMSVSLNPQGYGAITEQAPIVIQLLRKEGGFLPYNDDTHPDVIRKVFGMSKGSFKKLIGTLMREGKITIEEAGIRLR